MDNTAYSDPSPSDGSTQQANPYGDLTQKGVWSDPMWPGVIGHPVEHHMDESNLVGMPTMEDYQKNSEQDVEIGGRSGLVNRLPYTMGVATPYTVERFDLTGRILRLRRPPEGQTGGGSAGPVQGGRDHAGSLASQAAQQGMKDVPDWIAQSGIIEQV